MSLGMFCGVPLPFHIWDEKYTSLMVASLPLVGGIIGALWWLAGLLLLSMEAPLVLTAAVLALAPFLIAGFIHLDGYMDTSDAILSYRPLEDKLRILKDPRVGAFAVIMLGFVLILQFAAMFSVVERGGDLALLIVIPIISRGCSAMAIFVVRHMPESNYAALLRQNIGASHKIFVALIIIAAIAAAALYAGHVGLIVAAAVILFYVGAMAKAFKNFKGISGDLLGYSLVISELGGLIVWALF